MSVPMEGAVQRDPMNKFEQVSSDGRQMSLPGGSTCPISGGGGPHVSCLEGGGL